jgi:hypothetical protein
MNEDKVQVRLLPTQHARINEEVVAVLREVLSQAIAGNVNGVSLVITYSSTEAVTVQSVVNDKIKHLGGVTLLQAQLIKMLQGT